MKRIIFLVFVLIFLMGLIVPLEAQQQKKKDRWELELSYGQFWVTKQTLATNLIFEKESNPDFQLAMRLRIWRGWYVGLIGGLKKETQNFYFTDEVYTNYFWVEQRFGNFLAKNYIERFILDFKNSSYIGAETKINLFSFKFSQAISLIPYGKMSVKKWFSIADGFTYTTDYVLFDLDKSTTTPYMFYHCEVIPVGNWRAKGRETFWMANSDGSRGNIVYDHEWQSFITRIRPEGLIFCYGGGISFKWGKIVLSGEFQIERRKDVEILPPQLGGGNTIRKFQHAMWRVGLGYRF